MQAELDQSSIINASSQFWDQMLAMRLEPMEIPGEFCVGPGHIRATVALSGAWSGSIEVRMAERLAYEATAAMMMQPIETVAEADALDATKEIANMIAGVIKSSLPRPCNMTVPQSQVRGDGFCSPQRTESSLVVAFRHASGDVMVCVHEDAQGH
jgi:CheY-specific phosphatase CheX